jgi:hypothetical protein
MEMQKNINTFFLDEYKMYKVSEIILKPAEKDSQKLAYRIKIYFCLKFGSANKINTSCFVGWNF